MEQDKMRFFRRKIIPPDKRIITLKTNEAFMEYSPAGLAAIQEIR